MDPKLLDKIRVLLVDDDEDDYLIIKHLFAQMQSSSFVLEWVDSYEKAIKKVSAREHDIYLIDYRLGASTGLDILREVGALERPEPFILLTGVGDKGVELASLKLAASDYLVKKSLDSNMLSRTLYYALGRKEIERKKIEELVELTRTKDEFISIASHQLRTPATAVKQYVGMVLDGLAGDISSKQKKFLEKAYENNERQIAIVNDLLNVARVDAGGIDLTITEVDISELVNDAVSDMALAVERHQQRIDIKADSPVTAAIDENAIRMVIDNLLDNASKYSPTASTITIEIVERDDNVVVEVRDAGVGVAYPERLFQKFSRIDNPLSTKVGGTGLGLYWARSIAELHKGTLSYRANTPAGSIFTLSLPRNL